MTSPHSFRLVLTAYMWIALVLPLGAGCNARDGTEPADESLSVMDQVRHVVVPDSPTVSRGLSVTGTLRQPSNPHYPFADRYETHVSDRGVLYSRYTKWMQGIEGHVDGVPLRRFLAANEGVQIGQQSVDDAPVKMVRHIALVTGLVPMERLGWRLADEADRTHSLRFIGPDGEQVDVRLNGSTLLPEEASFVDTVILPAASAAQGDGAPPVLSRQQVVWRFTSHRLRGGVMVPAVADLMAGTEVVESLEIESVTVGDSADVAISRLATQGAS